MELLDEYDAATPVRAQYCTPLSTDQYEAQGSIETCSALDELIGYMKKNPQIYKTVLKKKKIDELEDEGVFSFLKTRFMKTIYGDEVFSVSNEECDAKIEEVTGDMVKAFNYNQDTKNTPVRFSKRLALKRTKKQVRKCKADVVNKGPPSYEPPPPPPLPTEASTVPPPPPPPALPVCSKKDASNERLITPLNEKTNTVSSAKSKTKRKSNEKSTSSNSKKTVIGAQPPVAGLHDEILKFSHHNLRSTKQTRSPGGTPVKSTGPRKKLSAADARRAFFASTSSESSESSSSPGFSPITAFNLQIIEKFRNTRSPMSNLSSPGSALNSPNAFN